MYRMHTTRPGRTALSVLAVVIGCSLAVGCGGATDAFRYFLGSPYPFSTAGNTQTTGPGSTGVGAGGTLDTTAGGTSNPCNEPQNRKFVRISMRNLSEDYVHYFLIMIAYVNGTTYPDGAVCPDDVALYQSNGYILVAEGSSVPLGNLCIVGPALYYYHKNGQFRGAPGAGGTSLASAIGPAQGSAATYDNFFTSAGASLPVPNQILFQNPGTGEGAALKVSINNTSPCDTTVVSFATPACQQDAFYYVGSDDRLVGSTALGFGSGRRVPDEIQGTGCNCGVSNDPWATLASSNLDASDVSRQSGLCNRFLRGGRIEFVFLRDDTDPPFPQLVWQVTDSSGSQAHQFDARAGVR